MANIFVRSPYIVTINETNQVETKIELRLWNGTGSAPTDATYTLSKLIPAPGQPATYYNISGYVREFLSFLPTNTGLPFQNQFNDLASYSLANSQWDIRQYCNIEIKKYFRTTSTGTFTLIGSAESHIGFDGYTLFDEGVNYNLGSTMLKEKTYYYLYKNPGGSTQTFLSNNPFYRPGALFLRATTNTLFARYTNLRTNAVVDINLTQVGFYVIPRVRLGNYADGNSLQIMSGSTVLYTATFKPKTECKYEPLVCDFVNRYGAWQREYFFKASKINIEVQNSEYNLYSSSFPTYYVSEGQRKTFNTTYKEKITVNTDWVSEDFSDNLRELMTSERILINDRPVKLITKQAELQKHINTKMINYTIEFEYANDIINLVV